MTHLLCSMECGGAKSSDRLVLLEASCPGLEPVPALLEPATAGGSLNKKYNGNVATSAENAAKPSMHANGC